MENVKYLEELESDEFTLILGDDVEAFINMIGKTELSNITGMVIESSALECGDLYGSKIYATESNRPYDLRAIYYLV